MTMALNDSGYRTKYQDGAVRETECGKGRCDLLPMDVLSTYLQFSHDSRGQLSVIEDKEELACAILADIDKYTQEGSQSDLFMYEALDLFVKFAYQDVWTALLDVSRQYEDGANKYSERNWEMGIPLHCYIDSAVRHLLKYLRGDNDEWHDRAFIWNILGALWTQNNLPEYCDIFDSN